MEPTTINYFTDSKSSYCCALKSMMQKAEQISGINDTLKDILPAPFKKKIWLARLENECAIFICQAPSIAFRANQQQALILDALIRVAPGKHVTRIKIKLGK